MVRRQYQFQTYLYVRYKWEINIKEPITGTTILLNIWRPATCYCLIPSNWNKLPQHIQLADFIDFIYAESMIIASALGSLVLHTVC